MAISHNTGVSSFMLIEALRKRYASPAWVFLPELRVGPDGGGEDNRRRMDGYAMAMHPSKKLKRVAFEVKISRLDFLREINNDSEKRLPAMALSNEFYFVAPKDMIKPSEIPIDCGLLEYHPWPADYLRVKIQAPHRDTPLPTWEFVASVLRRHDDLKHRICNSIQRAVLEK